MQVTTDLGGGRQEIVKRQGCEIKTRNTLRGGVKELIALKIGKDNEFP